MLYVDVILPLPLPGLYTYALPGDEQAEQGQRVVVQFGRKKLYAALIYKVHKHAPEGYEAKEVLSVLDSEPIVTQKQIELWQWMSRYYMCTLGEVMNASLPTALKLDSETRIVLNNEWDEAETELDQPEFVVAEALRGDNVLRVDEVQVLLDKKRVYPVIQSLMDKGVIEVYEELTGGYKPKTEKYLRLTEEMEEELALEGTLQALERAPKQLLVMEVFLQLLEDNPEVKKADVIQQAKATSTLVKNLVIKGILEEYEKQVDRLALDAPIVKTEPFDLSPAQLFAYAELQGNLDEHSTVLLHGVTSSGKTNLYIKVIEEHLEEGKQVLYLLPEIAITAQIIRRLRQTFGEAVGVYHSKFNEHEKVEIWQKVKSKKYQVVLGVRSSIFLPFQDLGLVIVDEEHDSSYKQFDPAPRYQARDTAIFLSTLFEAKTLLGSATPSLESYQNCKDGKYGLVELSERFGGIAMPKIQLVNMLDEQKKRKMKLHFTSVLLKEMEATLARNEQVILFQNRRGFAPYLMCNECSWIPKCRNCDVSLTYHQYNKKLRCHYCGFTIDMVSSCASCNSHDMRVRGFGTEKIEEEVEQLLPGVSIARLDLDSARGKQAHQEIIEDFENRKTQILVGTQMVTKGLDFDHVGLVGVLSADQLLSYPDFRANERAFQLMEQVSGRAGRKYKAGKVIIQTSHPEHPVIQAVKQHDYRAFFHLEAQFRSAFHYNPYYRLIKITLRHRNIDEVFKAARQFNQYLLQNVKGEIMGPAVPIIGRIKNYFLQDFLIKMRKDTGNIHHNKQAISAAIDQLNAKGQFPSVRVVVDVDP